MEPLTIATLKAVTPEDVQCEFFDDRVELIDYNTQTDLVVITVETYTAQRSYQIAKQFRDRNVPVIMGGYHVTLLPDEAEQYADSIVIGNAEDEWKGILQDVKQKRLRKRYNCNSTFSPVLPDRSIYKDKKYLALNLIETGRGCPFSCEFCAVSSYYKSCYTARSVKDIAAEVEQAKHRFSFFVDDNIVAQPGFLKKLCTEIAPLKTKWASQGTITMAGDRDLLKSMKKSGCEAILIGFESMDANNLKQMNKDWSTSVGQRDELVKAIHDEGISIYATFVFGFDYDTPETFKQALEFSQRNGFYFAAFNHLLPFPGTPIFERLQREGRLIRQKWWLDQGYKYGDIPFQPKQMSAEKLSELCAQTRRDFYKSGSVFKRWIKLLGRNMDPLMSLIFLSQNVQLGQEVDEKLNIPVGSGLDELPK
jgi:radical SAM superfamily enzyme YgiQ (UPF0313 family)